MGTETEYMGQLAKGLDVCSPHEPDVWSAAFTLLRGPQLWPGHALNRLERRASAYGNGLSGGGSQTKFLRLLCFAIAISFLVAIPSAAFATVGAPFDTGWRFIQGDAPGAELPGFDDSKWRKLDLPHDWSIEEPFAKTNKTGGAGAWAAHGVGWYRKAFHAKWDGRGSLGVEFDGVMQNSEVWINGVPLGKRPFGYVSFVHDLTPHIKFGESAQNVIAVRADTSAQPASRWYSGAGIYRHVRLLVAGPVHLEPHASFVTTPVIQSNSATIRIETRVVNDSKETRKLTVMAAVFVPPGAVPARRNAIAGEGESSLVSVEPGKSEEVKFDVTIPSSPQLWSLDQPDLHQALIRVRDDGRTLDSETISFGIREARFDSDTGFSLNGENLKLKGVCLHHDGSAFGAAVPLAVWKHRLTQLRELGCNAIRTAHNPPAPELLDLCDRMGFLVMDEFFDCWTVGKNRHDYHLYFDEWSKRDAADTVRRDRNHPCVILYSVGNEIHDTPKAELANRILRGLVEVCHENDPTRPVTQALFRPNVSGDYTNGLADQLDVIGTNYRDQELLAAWRAKAGRKIVGTEQGHDRRTWLACRDNPQHSGQFLWVGVDYLGESRSWPRIAYGGGLLDRTGQIKPMAYERQSWWSDKPMVRAVRRVAADDVMPDDPGYGGEERHTQVQYADWTPRNLEAHTENVEVYSNCEEVELLLNGTSFGTKPINKDASPRVWKVAFEAGTLRAVARNAGKAAATDELRTAGKAARIVLTTDRKVLPAGWDEVAFARVAVVDENGVVVPRAKDLIRFNISGPGVIAAVDSADNTSLEPFQATERRAYQGRCEAAVRALGSPGSIFVTAEAAGLKPGSVVIETPHK
jgi:beta-galactosidase